MLRNEYNIFSSLNIIEIFIFQFSTFINVCNFDLGQYLKNRSIALLIATRAKYLIVRSQRPLLLGNNGNCRIARITGDNFTNIVITNYVQYQNSSQFCNFLTRFVLLHYFFLSQYRQLMSLQRFNLDNKQSLRSC